MNKCVIIPYSPNGKDPKAFEGSASLSENGKNPGDQFTEDVIDPVTGQWARGVEQCDGKKCVIIPYWNNGSHDKAFEGSASLNQMKHHKKHKETDVNSRGMDSYVHGFVHDNVPGDNQWERGYKKCDGNKCEIIEYWPNGSHPKAFEGSAAPEKSFSQRKHHKKPDVIGAPDMDEKVHGFVSDNLPPLRTSIYESNTMPFVPNGSDSSAFKGAFNEKKHHKKHHKHHKHRDVAERGMDEEVHEFVKEAIPPLNTRVRSDDPFVPNGSDPSAHEGAAFISKNIEDDEGAIEADQYDSYISGQPKFLYPKNSSTASAFVANAALAQKPDIAERNMDETWVHPFTTSLDVVLPTANPYTRPYTPYTYNGGEHFEYA